MAKSIIIAVLAALALTLADAAAAQGALNGSYRGVGPAEGMSFTLAPAGEKLAGEFRDSNGATAKIDATWVEGGAEAVLPFPQRSVFVRIVPESVGAQMIVLPIDPEGAPQAQEARALPFVREGVEVPTHPRGYQNPPAKMGRVLDPDVFLVSYEFWPPDGVVRGFDAIGPRYRAMLRLYPLLHADVLSKLCKAPDRPPEVAEALRGQGADCKSVVRDVESAFARGKFNAYKAAVHKQRDDLLAAVQCSRRYIVKETVCGPASRRLAEAATKMETVDSALGPYR